MKLAARLAMLTYLPTRSLLTRREEIVGIEVEVLDVGVQLGGDVVAQPLGVHAELEIAQRVDAGAARLGHLLAGNADEAVDVDVVGHLVGRAGELQHRRPEQGVEVDDVLADEVDLLGVGSAEQSSKSRLFFAQ